MSNINKKSALLFFGFAPSGLDAACLFKCCRQAPRDFARRIVKIVAIRHGESGWNYAKDPNNNKEWKERVNMPLVFTDSHEDSPLCDEGVRQSEKIHKYFQKATDAFNEGYPEWLKGKVADGEVAFAMSNLRRAQDTLKIGLRDVIPLPTGTRGVTFDVNSSTIKSAPPHSGLDVGYEVSEIRDPETQAVLWSADAFTQCVAQLEGAGKNNITARAECMADGCGTYETAYAYCAKENCTSKALNYDGNTRGEHPIYMMTDLQESGNGQDAGTSRTGPQMLEAFKSSGDEGDLAKYGRDFEYNFDHDKCNNVLRKYTSKQRAHDSLETFFGFDKEIVVYVGHSHQTKNMMKMLVKNAGIGKDSEWYKKTLSDVWSTHEKLENGGAMEFEVEYLENGSFRIVANSWRELPDHAGLQRKKSRKLTIGDFNRQASQQAIFDRCDRPVSWRESIWNWWTSPKRWWRNIGCGNRGRASSRIAHDDAEVPGRSEPFLVAAGTNPGAPQC